MIIPFLKSFFRRHLCQDMAQVDVTIKIRSRLSSKTYLCFLHFFPSTYARSGLAVTDSVSNVSSQDQLAKSVYHTIIAQSVLCPTKKEEEKEKKKKRKEEEHIADALIDNWYFTLRQPRMSYRSEAHYSSSHEHLKSDSFVVSKPTGE